MKRILRIAPILLAVGCAGTALAQHSSSFTYQGHLQAQGEPYTGSADYSFRLWNAETDGQVVSGLVLRPGVEAENGLFQTPLDFGSGALTGDRWMAISVRTPSWDGVGDEPPFTALPGRQRITASPYSVQTRGIFVNADATRVGIGTTQPVAPLHIVPIDGVLIGNDGAGATALQMKVSQAMGGFGQIQAVRSAGSEWGNLVLNQSGGNVGIGTISPQAKLHVQGSAIVTNSLSANGGITFPGGGRINNMFAAGPFTIDPSSTAAGGIVGFAFSAPGAQVGDFVIASNFPRVVNFVITAAEVQAPGIVAVFYRNLSGLANDPPPIDVSLLIFKR